MERTIEEPIKTVNGIHLAEFVDGLRTWEGNWTLRQASYFDRVWEKYYG